MRYGIVTPYTSYLALEPGAQVGDVTAMPANGRGGGRLMTNAPAPPPKAADAKVVTGMIAVQQSKRAREQQEAARVDKDDLSSAVRAVAGKTFYLREGVWTDAEFKVEAHLSETTLASDSWLLY